VAKSGPASLHTSQLAARSPEAIGERLALGLTQEKFAAAVGCPQGTFGQYEAGMRKPSVAVASRVFDRFRIPLDYLYLGEVSSLPFELAKAVSAQTVKR
jgi:transcriptional regulator with XRE-family HTH domain